MVFIGKLVCIWLTISSSYSSISLTLVLIKRDGMNIILEYSVQARVLKFTTNNTALLLLRAFMDDLSLMSSTVSG